MKKLFLALMALCVVSPIVKAAEPDPLVIIYDGRFINMQPGGKDMCDLRFNTHCFVVIIDDAQDIVVLGNTTTYHDATIEKHMTSGTVTSSHDEVIVESGSFTIPGGGTSDVQVSYVN